MLKKTFIFLSIFFLLAGATAASGQVGTDIGQQAPNFTLENISGKEVSLEDHREQIVFLNFWATWCPPCKEEMPAIQKLYEEYDEVAILAVNVRENKDKVLNYLMDHGYNFPILLDMNREVAQQYAVRGIPTTYVIDAGGVITDKHTGALTFDKIEDMIDSAQDQ